MDGAPDPGPVRGSARGGPRAAGSALLAVGVAALVATVVAFPPGGDAPVLSPDPVPEASFGVTWSPRMETLEAGRAAATARLVDTVRMTGLLAGLVAIAGALAVLVVGGAREGRAFAVRAALGAGPTALAALAARRRGGPLLGRGLGVGGSVGVLLGVALRWTWPHVRSPVPPEPWLPALVAGVVVSAAAGAVSIPVVRGVRRLPGLLAVGARSTASHREGALRRIVVVLQLSASVVLLAGGAALARAGLASGVPDPGGASGSADTLLLPLSVAAGLSPEARESRWAAALERVRTHASLRAESLATPGSWRGLGTRDLVVAECGGCVRGGLAVFLSAETASHHAVSPGFFDAADLAVLAGRGIGAGDGPGAPAVAVVSRSFASRNFQDGDPLGRRVRVGEEGVWLEVVGVVEDADGAVLGRPVGRAPAVYLSLAQHPPELAVLSLRTTASPADATALVTAELAREGVQVDAEARPHGQLRRREAAPFRWGAGAAALLGILGLTGAVGSVRATAAAEMSARRREMAVRSALGAGPRALLRWTLRRWAGHVAWALVLALPGLVAVAGLARLSGAEPARPSAPLVLGVGVLVALAVLTAVAPEARRAGRADPGAALSE